MAIKLQNLDPVTVASAGTTYPLSPDYILVASVTIQASFSNVSKIVLGGANLTSANGLEIPPGDVATIDAPVGARGSPEDFPLSEVFITSTSSGDSIRILSFRRKP